MGLDQALLEAGTAQPTLRFYTWSPDVLSLGYFQRHDSVPGSQRAGAILRRVTGGGAIHHVGELTFSISAPLTHPLYAGVVGLSYARVHRVIARALRAYGIAADLRGPRKLASDRAGTGMCFHASTELDLVWDGRKGVGSAQRRKAGRVLHHGSIKLAASPLDVGVATVPEVTPEEFSERLLESFRAELSIACERDVPTPAERDLARACSSRYLDPAFLRRR